MTFIDLRSNDQIFKSRLLDNFNSSPLLNNNNDIFLPKNSFIPIEKPSQLPISYNYTTRLNAEYDPMRNDILINLKNSSDKKLNTSTVPVDIFLDHYNNKFIVKNLYGNILDNSKDNTIKFKL